MRRQSSVVVIAALALAGCRVGRQETTVFVDPQLTALVPRDTTLIAGTRVEHLVTTPLYKKYLAGGRIRSEERRVGKECRL